jgi:hypothetical protein
MKIIRHLVLKALGVKIQAWPNFNCAYRRVTVIQVTTQGRCSVQAVRDTDHNPPTC